MFLKQILFLLSCIVTLSSCDIYLNPSEFISPTDSNFIVAVLKGEIEVTTEKYNQVGYDGYGGHGGYGGYGGRYSYKTEIYGTVEFTKIGTSDTSAKTKINISIRQTIPYGYSSYYDYSNTERKRALAFTKYAEGEREDYKGYSEICQETGGQIPDSGKIVVTEIGGVIMQTYEVNTWDVFNAVAGILGSSVVLHATEDVSSNKIACGTIGIGKVSTPILPPSFKEACTTTCMSGVGLTCQSSVCLCESLTHHWSYAQRKCIECNIDPKVGWTGYEDICWKYFKVAGGVNFRQAHAKCIVEEDANLIELESDAKFNYITAQYALADRTGTAAWINTERTGHPNFYWSNGEQVNIAFWGTNEPNNSGGDQECGEILENTKKLNDAQCNRMRDYICEFRSL